MSRYVSRLRSPIEVGAMHCMQRRCRAIPRPIFTKPILTDKMGTAQSEKNGLDKKKIKTAQATPDCILREMPVSRLPPINRAAPPRWVVWREGESAGLSLTCSEKRFMQFWGRSHDNNIVIKAYK